MTTEAIVRATRGFEWLNEQYPDHVRDFNPDEFSLTSATTCVLAQASKMDFDCAMAENDLLRSNAEYLGFFAARDAFGYTETDWIELEYAWRALYVTAKGLQSVQDNNTTTGE